MDKGQKYIRDIVMDIIRDLEGIGYELTLKGEKIVFRYCHDGMPPAQARHLMEELRAHKAEAVEYLRRAQPLPFFEADGNLVIPFNSDPRYRWWDGGQGAGETEREVKSWKH